MKLPTAQNSYDTQKGELHNIQHSFFIDKAIKTWTNMSRATFEPAIPQFRNLRQ